MAKAKVQNKTPTKLKKAVGSKKQERKKGYKSVNKEKSKTTKSKADRKTTAKHMKANKTGRKKTTRSQVNQDDMNNIMKQKTKVQNNKGTPQPKKKKIVENKASAKKTKKTEEVQNFVTPIPNGVQKNRKRRIDFTPNDETHKKSKKEAENIKPTLLVSEGETEKVEVRKKTGPLSKIKAVTKKINKKITVPKESKSSVGSRTAVKRQKAILEVPKLSSKSGVLFVIGDNAVGQLGLDEAIQEKKRPVEHTFPGHFVDIAAGGMHSVCLTDKGEVYTFGCNDEGALGRITEGEEGSEYIPRRVDIPDVVVKVSAGDSHSAALTENGRVYIWGNFRSGEGPMGLIRQQVKSLTPIRILHNVTTVSIASGSEHFVCLSNEGDVYTCGCGDAGQLGRISERSCKGDGRKGLVELLEPKIVPIIQGGRSVTVDGMWTGYYSTFLRCKTTKAIYAFGLNNYYQLGLSLELEEDAFERGRIRYTPERVRSYSTNIEWKRISGGQHHTLSLDSNGKVYSHGRPEYGRLGFGEDCPTKMEPTLIPTLEKHKCIDISSGNLVSFSVTEEGSVYSWGFGTNYQLGHGNDEDRHVPKLIEGNFLNSWHAFKVSGGGQHTLILANRKGATEDKSTVKE